MKICNNFRDLICTINSANIIGIDGADGSGKTTLSKEIGQHLGLPILNLDDYLIRSQGSYVDHLKYNELLEFIEINKNTLIIEGLCLIDVLKRIDLQLDCFIYVKLMNNIGEWLDEEECDIKGSVNEMIQELGRRVKMVEPECQGISIFREEIISYHKRSRPFEKADIIFESICE